MVGGWRPTLGEWTCHCSVLWLGGQLWGSGAIAGCRCSVLWLEGDGQLWGSGAIAVQGAFSGCHCCVGCDGRVSWVVFNFLVERRPSTFGIIRTHCQRGTGRPMSPKIGGKKMWREKNCLELLADVTLFSTLITQKLVFAIWALCWYYFCFASFCGDSNRSGLWDCVCVCWGDASCGRI